MSGPPAEKKGFHWLEVKHSWDTELEGGSQLPCKGAHARKAAAMCS